MSDAIARRVCAARPHRQIVFTIPKRLRLYFRYDRRLLGGLARAAWQTIVQVFNHALDREDIVPGMIAGIQTFGELLHFHPHIHALVTDGGFTPDGAFVRLPQVDRERLLAVWQTNVFKLLLAAGKIDQETVNNMRSWTYSGFSVDNSVYLAPGDTFGLERLAQYILRCPFSLARIVRLTDDGSVLYRAENGHCRRFPGPASADLRGGPKRNFQVFSALDFLAELTQHVPDKGEHLVRYYGWYSHRSRGIRANSAGTGSFCAVRGAKCACPPLVCDDGEQTCLTPSSDGSGSDTFFPTQSDAPQTEALGKKVSDSLPGSGPRAGSLSTWGMLLKRVFEVDPLKCPHCGGQMKIIGFIERRQHEVIERILRHCGLWEGPIRTLASPRAPPPGAEAANDRQLVLDEEFLQCQRLEHRLENQPVEPCELQLVLDPEYL